MIRYDTDEDFISAVDKSQQSSLSDARDALINAAIDVLSAFKLTKSSYSGGLLAPDNLKLLPLYIVALMKHVRNNDFSLERKGKQNFSATLMNLLFFRLHSDQE